MTDDLVQRLRRTYRKEYAPTGSMCGDNSNKPFPFPILATEVPVNPDGHEAADRLEALTAALDKFDNLIQYQYTGSREAMSAMAEAAQEGARVLGRGAWKEAGQPWLWTYDAHLKEKKP